MSSIRVILVDDHALFADAIGATLRSSGIDVVGTARTLDEARRLAASERPDVALVDLDLRDGALDVGRELDACHPEVKLVALGTTDSTSTIRAAKAAGFGSFVSKDSPVTKVATALRDVATGRRVQIRQRRSSATQDRRAALVSEELTPREREVLELLVRGAEGATIARELGIRPNTVRTHVQSLLGKLSVHSRLEAAAYATRHRLVAPTQQPARRNAG